LPLIFTRIHSHPSEGHRNCLDGLDVLWLNFEMVSWRIDVEPSRLVITCDLLFLPVSLVQSLLVEMCANPL
jgi:hypothetical protein